MKRTSTKDRLAWAQKLGPTLLPSPTGESGWIQIPGKAPSKANLHEVHFAPSLWRQIAAQVKWWRNGQTLTKRRGMPFWVSPGDAVIAWEASVAQLIAAQETFRFEGPLALEVRLYAQGTDADNATKILMDVLQRAQIIKNDNQIIRLTVEKFPAEEPHIEMKVRTYAQRTAPAG